VKLKFGISDQHTSARPKKNAQKSQVEKMFLFSKIKERNGERASPPIFQGGNYLLTNQNQAKHRSAKAPLISCVFK
jgi:hypothetical protein